MTFFISFKVNHIIFNLFFFWNKHNDNDDDEY